MSHSPTLTEIRRELARMLAELARFPVTMDRERDALIEYSLHEAG
jgi:hypothetical protein